ncbi:MAG: NADH-quinone oxidoreductase subunit N [Acidimicrobiia bacterium]
MITPPEISWIAIGADIALAIGAAVVLLVDVQWKPASRVLGWVVGVTLVAATALTVLQWLEGVDATAAGETSSLLAFSGLISMDGFAVFSRLTLIAATALGLASGWRFVVGLGRRGAEALALVLLATAGFSLMVASNNLVMMFLGLEVGSIALYVLAGLARERRESEEAAIKYFLLGSFASAIFVYGVALIYAGTRQFEIIEIGRFLDDFIVTRPAVIYIGIGLVIAGLGFKVSAAPFHAWAPDVYQGAPAGLVGYLAAVAKVAGFAAIARILLTAVPELDVTWLPVVAGISVLSMLVGSVLALVQSDVRRLLAYSGVAHAGFIMTGVVGGSTEGILFYLAIYSIQLVGAFAVVAVVSGPDGAGSSLDEYRGLGRRSPLLAAAFTVLLLGMGGLPLTSGFVAKFGVFTEAWSRGFEWLVIAAVVLSVVAFAFYIRVIVVMYMDDAGDTESLRVGPERWVLAIAVGTTIFWGIFPSSLLDLAADALPL